MDVEASISTKSVRYTSEYKKLNQKNTFLYHSINPVQIICTIFLIEILSFFNKQYDTRNSQIAYSEFAIGLFYPISNIERTFKIAVNKIHRPLFNRKSK